MVPTTRSAGPGIFDRAADGELDREMSASQVSGAVVSGSAGSTTRSEAWAARCS